MRTRLRLHHRAWRAAPIAALLAALGACASVSPRAGKPLQTPATASDQLATDASYDWHGLLQAPFGSTMQSVPLTLHEVLLFREEGRGGVPSDDEAECYATDAPAPRFVAGPWQEYMLCFKRDRLARIQANARLTAEGAPETFAAACAHWAKNAAVPNGAVPQNTAPQNTTLPAAVVCEGRDGATHYLGRLDEDQESAAAILSIVLDAAPDLR